MTTRAVYDDADDHDDDEHKIMIVAPTPLFY